MFRANAMTLLFGITVAASAGLATELFAQAPADPNGAPNPYRLDANWLKAPDGRKIGQVTGVDIDPDGKSVWVFDRCGSNECTSSTVAPIQKFDSSGAFQRAFGAGVFAVPHSFYVDRDGNVWAGDQVAKNGKGADLIKFSPDGTVLMTLGKPGMPGDAPGYLSAVSAVVVAPNGDMYVADGHGAGTNDRIVKLSKDGKLITTWGKHGKGPGEFDTPHGIALDSAGRVYVADRANNRIQIFEPDGKFIAEWKQFGRPSDVAIGKDDMIYVADSQSDEKTNPGFKQGIRVGSAKDGKVTGFIEESKYLGALEGVGVDDDGNIYAGYTNAQKLEKFAKKLTQ
jgi:DNA-binding beta-propeller fold protein YncE